MNALRFLVARLREPSTLAAITALGVLAGVPPGTVDLVAQIAVGAVGLAAVLVPEKAAQ